MHTNVMKINSFFAFEEIQEEGSSVFMLPVFDQSILGLALWQWLGIVVLVILCFAASWLARMIMNVIAETLSKHFKGQVSKPTLERMILPIRFAAAVAVLVEFLPLLEFSQQLIAFLVPVRKVVVVIAATWSIYRLTDAFGEFAESIARKTEDTFDDLLVTMIRKMAKIVIVVFGGIYLANSLGQEIGPLVAALGVGSLGVAFALRNTIENFFGSIMVLIDRPFEVGDWVNVDGVEGTVEDVGFRCTRIRTFYNSLVVVPNLNLISGKIDNYGKRKFRRWRTVLSLEYSTPPESIEAFCEGVRELIRNHPYTRKEGYQVWFNEFSGSSLDVLLYMFFEAPDWSTELRERQRLGLDILRLADKMGVLFAFPTQTIHFQQNESFKNDKAFKMSPDELAESQAQAHGLKEAREIPRVAGKPAPYKYDAGESGGNAGGDGEG